MDDETRALYDRVVGDLHGVTDPVALHNALRERQDRLDAVVSEIKIRRAEIIAEMHDGGRGKSLAVLADELGYGGYQRVQKVLAQTAEVRAARASQNSKES